MNSAVAFAWGWVGSEFFSFAGRSARLHDLLQQCLVDVHRHTYGMHLFIQLHRCLLAILVCVSCATNRVGTAPAPERDASPNFAALIAAPDRSAADRDTDEKRRPAELLSFFDVRSGQVVAELCAGGGYTTELLARAVGSTGKVYGQNPAVVLQRFAAKPWAERLGRPAMTNVVRVDREMEDPLPEDAQQLDLIVMVLFYHDTIWFGTDRTRMNQAIFRALKPGGAFVVVDHSARTGAGTDDAESLHRIDEEFVKAEVLSAGFILAGRSGFLHNAADSRDWNVFDKLRRGSSDRFALRFVKP